MQRVGAMLGWVKFPRRTLYYIWELKHMRNLAEKRHNDWKKAIRKKKIINAYGWDYYDNLHQYSKNKIHCSCPLCASKTRGKTVKKTGGPGENWSIRDEKRIEEMDDQLLDNE